MVSSGVCNADTSAAVAITVNPVIAGNTVGSNQSILSGGTPAALTGSLPTGGSGTYTYSWLSSTSSATSGFVLASGTNNTQNYTPSALTTNTWYRRLVTSGGCSDTSTAVAITITSGISGNTITANQTICSGSTPAVLTGALPTGGTGTFTYTWLASTSSATSGFAAASGTNNTQNYTPGALTQNTWYRRYVVSGVATDTSAAVAITVNAAVAGNTATGVQTICSGSTPSVITGSTPTGGTGTYTYTWLASSSSATAGFTAASGTNNTQNYTPGALTANTWYRRIVSSGVCNADTSAAVAITVNVAGTWTGTSSTAWANIANWSCPQVPTSTTNVTINSGATNMPTVTDLQQCNNLTIGAGAVLTITGANGQLNIFGNLTNNGTFINTSNGTTAFTGSTQQTVPAGTYTKLEINNPAGVLLGGSVVLSDSLILVNGIISLGGNSLTLGNNTFSSVGSGTSYVRTNGSGNVVVNNVGSTGKTGNVLIPVGNSTYNPVLLNNTGSNDNFTIWVTDSVTNAYTGSTPTGAKLTSNAVNRTWIINEGTAGGSNVTVTLQWNAGDELAGFNRAASYVSRYNGIVWDGTSASAALGANPYTLSRSGITSFSPFGVGSGGALPVQLISFEANKVKNNVLLSWQTASELNNAYFEVERSFDGQVFEVLDNKVKGQGTTQIRHDYAFTDVEALAFAKNNGSTIYYRLKQVDFDGAFNYSEVRSVDMGNAKGIAQLQPNPYNDAAYVVMESSETGQAEIVVTDVKGSVVLSQQSTIAEGYNQLLLANAETLQGGMYFVTIKQGSNTMVMKLVKK
ncbi:MAG: T9SS C-terminal target domain-containing protein [Bacteroidetes bacterium]|nr:MAG: T9SS C-terminal target domain-containing protein [Bacteroidota bacterium]